MVAASFGRFNLLSPLVNLVAVPVFGLGVWLLAAALACAPLLPWAAEALATWGWLLVRGPRGGRRPWPRIRPRPRTWACRRPGRWWWSCGCC